MDIEQKTAEILVECGYATHYQYLGYIAFIRKDVKMTGEFKVRPFDDDLEGRRQADAIEDWIGENQHSLWHLSEFDVCEQYENSRESVSNRQWRLDRIKFCIEKLAEDK